MPAETLLSLVNVKLNGTPASTDFLTALRFVEVDASLHMPAMATLEIADKTKNWVDDASLAIGKEIEISTIGNGEVGESTLNVIFKGVISAHEPRFDSASLYFPMVVRAYDRLHLLHRGSITEAFTSVTDSDVAKKVIQAAGLSADVTATTVTNDHMMRGDLSSHELLQLLARRNGFVTYTDGSTVHWKRADQLNFPTVAVEFGKELLEFRPVVSTTGQVNEVQVSGWDRKQKRSVTGTAATPDWALSAPANVPRGPAAAQSQFSSAKLHISEPIQQQAAADTLAHSTFNRMAASDLTGEGVMHGNSKVMPGGKLTISKVGARFGGTYLVTRVRHVWGFGEAHLTNFWLGGMTSGTIGTLLSDDIRRPMSQSAIAATVQIAVVTNNTDPDGLGRVKLKYPALSESVESFWAPVVSAGAGNDRGFFVLPEVNDEVLVSFVNGDLNQPYVLGGLWNGKDKTPTAQSAAASSSGVEIREFKTRVGHVLRFTDKQGSEKIELIDKTGKNSLVIESAAGKFTINCEGPMTIKAGADVKIEATGNVDVKANAEVKVSGATVNVEATGKLGLKAPMIEIAGSGMVKISGGMVQLN
ncbi:MAG: VgrG-related protein [bacterium]